MAYANLLSVFVIFTVVRSCGYLGGKRTGRELDHCYSKCPV